MMPLEYSLYHTQITSSSKHNSMPGSVRETIIVDIRNPSMPGSVRESILVHNYKELLYAWLCA